MLIFYLRRPLVGAFPIWWAPKPHQLSGDLHWWPHHDDKLQTKCGIRAPKKQGTNWLTRPPKIMHYISCTRGGHRLVPDCVWWVPGPHELSGDQYLCACVCEDECFVWWGYRESLVVSRSPSCLVYKTQHIKSLGHHMGRLLRIFRGCPFTTAQPLIGFNFKFRWCGRPTEGCFLFLCICPKLHATSSEPLQLL